MGLFEKFIKNQTDKDSFHANIDDLYGLNDKLLENEFNNLDNFNISDNFDFNNFHNLINNYKTNRYITDHMCINIKINNIDKPFYTYSKCKQKSIQSNEYIYKLDSNFDTIKEIFIQIKLLKPFDELERSEIYDLLNTHIEFYQTDSIIFNLPLIILILNAMIYEYNLIIEDDIIQIPIYIFYYNNKKINTIYGLYISDKILFENCNRTFNNYYIKIKLNNTYASYIDVLSGGYILPLDILEKIHYSHNMIIQTIQSNVLDLDDNIFSIIDSYKATKGLFFYFDHTVDLEDFEYIEIEYEKERFNGKFKKIYTIDQLMVFDIFGYKLYLIPSSYELKDIDSMCEFHLDIYKNLLNSNIYIDKIKFKTFSESIFSKIYFYRIGINMMINYFGLAYYKYN